MTRSLLYVASPLRPNDAEVDAIAPFTISPGRGEYELDAKIWKPHETRVREALRANLDRAMRWLSWLRRSFTETTFIAPWIVDILSGADDSDPAQREAGMQDNFAVIERCDGIVLCGPRISEGMRREMNWGVERGWCRTIMYSPTIAPHEFDVYDLTDTCGEPPDKQDCHWLGPDPGRCPMPWQEWARCFLR